MLKNPIGQIVTLMNVLNDRYMIVHNANPREQRLAPPLRDCVKSLAPITNATQKLTTQRNERLGQFTCQSKRDTQRSSLAKALVVLLPSQKRSLQMVVCGVDIQTVTDSRTLMNKRTILVMLWPVNRALEILQLASRALGPSLTPMLKSCLACIHSA